MPLHPLLRAGGRDAPADSCHAALLRSRRPGPLLLRPREVNERTSSARLTASSPPSTTTSEQGITPSTPTTIAKYHDDDRSIVPLRLPCTSTVTEDPFVD